MIATVLAFASGALAAAGLVVAIPGGAFRPGIVRAARRRARADRGESRGAKVVRLLAAAVRRAGPVRSLAAPHELEARIAAAGLVRPARAPHGPLDVRELMAAKLGAAGFGALLGMLLAAAAPGRLGVAVTVAGPIAGFLMPDLWLARRARNRARRVREELPGMLDLLRVTVDAGLSLTAALTAVGTRTRGVLGGEWRTVGREVALGVPLVQALSALSTRLPVGEITALIGALERSLRHGAPLADTLEAQARDARASRRRRIQERAAQAGPKIQLVVALLLVPSVLLMVAAALLAAMLDGAGGVTIA